MGIFTGARLWIILGVTVALIGALTWHLTSDAKTRKALVDERAAHAQLRDEAENVVLATQAASDNPDVVWNTVTGQIVALGNSNRELKEAVQATNQKITDMAAEAVRLKRQASELRKLADKARAQRSAALRRLSDLETPPAVKRDCQQLVSEANAALDMLYEQGF